MNELDVIICQEYTVYIRTNNKYTLSYIMADGHIIRRANRSDNAFSFPVIEYNPQSVYMYKNNQVKNMTIDAFIDKYFLDLIVL